MGGGQRVVSIYARELERIGHDVQIVCSRPRRITLKKKIKSFIYGRGWPKPPRAICSHFESYGAKYLLVDHDSGIRECDVPDADVVVATFWDTAHFMRDLGDCKGRKYYLIQHDEGSIQYCGNADATYTFPAYHIYVSEWIASRLRARHAGIHGTVINNSVDTEAFDLGRRQKPSTLRVGMMWISDPLKGCDIAIEAVRQARSQGVDIELVAFGTIPPPKEILSEMQHFTLMPDAESMAAIYSSCTLWLFTSRFEGFGLPILEAMAARTPVVGTPTGAATELLGQGGGILVGMEDVKGISGAIKLIDDMSPSNWERMSEMASATAKKRSWSDAARELEAVFTRSTIR